MQIISLTKEKYRDWDKFCLESDDAWFEHTSKCLEYNLNYRPKLKSTQESFFITDSNKIVAICPLILEINKGVKEFSSCGYYGITPAFANNLTKKSKKRVKKELFAQIDRLATENNVKRAMFRCPPLAKSFVESNKQKNNYLMRFGYLDVSLNTQIVDLRKSIEELRLDVRHGHDADIDKASKFLKADVFDKSNITKDIFEEYIQMHHKAARRITRPRSTFDMMYSWIKEENGFLIGAKKDNKFVGFSYFELFKDNVCYSSSCNDPDADNLPIAHFIQWAAIKYMKYQKYRFYELGQQNYSNTLSNFPSAREISISRFKRGFGGFTVPLFMAEKYYDGNYFLKVYQERIERYLEEMK